MKSLNDILNESSGDEQLGRMMAEYKVFISTLKSLGFEKAPIGSSTYKPGSNRGKVEELWGIPMRAGKWTDIFFAVMYDDRLPWRIVDRDGTESYAKLNDASKALMKRMRTIKEEQPDDETDSVYEQVEVDTTLARELKKRGFVEAPVNKFASHFIGVKNLKGKIQHVYGVSIKPRTWINLFFVITGEDDNNSAAYEKRVRELEKDGLTTSDAQAAADVEFGFKTKKSSEGQLQYAVVYYDKDLKAIPYSNFSIALKMLDLKKAEFDREDFYSEGIKETDDKISVVYEQVEVDTTLVKALKKRGFIEAPVNKFAGYFVGVKNLKGKIQNIFGVSTRPRAWINLFFMILDDETRPYAVVYRGVDAQTFSDYNVALKALDKTKAEFDKEDFYSEGTEEEADPVGESLALLEDVSEMTDDIYSTLSDLDSIDEDVRAAIASIYTALDELYAMVDEKYEIEMSDDDYDFSDMEEELGNVRKSK